jgi:hypothetical protein
MPSTLSLCPLLLYTLCPPSTLRPLPLPSSPPSSLPLATAFDLFLRKLEKNKKKAERVKRILKSDFGSSSSSEEDADSIEDEEYKATLNVDDGKREGQKEGRGRTEGGHREDRGR